MIPSSRPCRCSLARSSQYGKINRPWPLVSSQNSCHPFPLILNLNLSRSKYQNNSRSYLLTSRLRSWPVTMWPTSWATCSSTLTLELLSPRVGICRSGRCAETVSVYNCFLVEWPEYRRCYFQDREVIGCSGKVSVSVSQFPVKLLRDSGQREQNSCR